MTALPRFNQVASPDGLSLRGTTITLTPESDRRPPMPTDTPSAERIAHAINAAISDWLGVAGKSDERSCIKVVEEAIAIELAKLAPVIIAEERERIADKLRNEKSGSANRDIFLFGNDDALETLATEIEGAK